MNFSLIKLRFVTPVHFGSQDSALSLLSSDDHFRADTLFSALCHTVLSLKGEEGIDELIRLAKDGDLRLSDSMPWEGNRYYIPKPMMLSESRKETDPALRKAVKKLAWLPIEDLDTFLGSIKGVATLDINKYRQSFGTHYETTRVRISAGEDSLPYQVGQFAFDDNCGLYIIVGYTDEEIYHTVRSYVEALGLTGIGGKVSSGLGKFEIDDEILLDAPFDRQTDLLSAALSASQADRYILLTTSLPREDELSVMENAAFQMTRRAGFVASPSFAETPQKKQTQYFVSAGSVFSSRFDGDLYPIASGNHIAYRYAKPIFLGVKL